VESGLKIISSSQILSRGLSRKLLKNKVHFLHKAASESFEFLLWRRFFFDGFFFSLFRLSEQFF
jgi:hypothetical protein